MQVIDILNKRANNEAIPLKIKIADDIYVMNNFTESIERIYVWVENNDTGWFDREYLSLHDEVEIVEEDEEDTIEKLRKDLEELKKEFDILKTDVYVHINDILRYNGAPITITCNNGLGNSFDTDWIKELTDGGTR